MHKISTARDAGFIGSNQSNAFFNKKICLYTVIGNLDSLFKYPYDL